MSERYFREVCRKGISEKFVGKAIEIETFAGVGAMERRARGFPFGPHCIRRWRAILPIRLAEIAAAGTGGTECI